MSKTFKILRDIFMVFSWILFSSVIFKNFLYANELPSNFRYITFIYHIYFCKYLFVVLTIMLIGNSRIRIYKDVIKRNLIAPDKTSYV